MAIIVGIAANFPAIQSYILPAENISSGSQSIIITENAATTPRWNHFPLTIYIENTQYTKDVAAAMDAWASATNNSVTFAQTADPNADVTARWVSNLRVGSKDATGDTNLKYIDTWKYSVIASAQIEFLTQYRGMQMNDADMANIAIHEIGHALGLEHSNSSGDIMYPTLELPSRSVKQIPPAYPDFLYKVYSTPAEPDLSFYGDINATKFVSTTLLAKRYYLNASFAIKNLGISKSLATSVGIYAGGSLLENLDTPPIEPGSSYIISVGNLRSDNDFSSVMLAIDPGNSMAELDKTNNAATVDIR